MSEPIFRQKSLDRISSPEQLNEYIRVSNPGIWMVLAAIVLLLLGVCVWGVLGHLDTTVMAAARSENGAVTVYVREEDISSVEEGMRVILNEEEYIVHSVSADPVAVDDSFSDYFLHTGGLKEGQWVFPVTVDAELPAGVYRASILVERVSPMSFVLN